MKTTAALGVLFVLILCGGYLIFGNHTSMSTNVPTGTSSTTISSTDASTATSSTANTTSSSTTTTTTAAGTSGSYTSVDVAMHGTSKSCWASISGNVYDLTSWISQHPGGEARILEICGKDGTSAFEGQHGNDSRAQDTLATFKIGTLAT